MRVEDKMEWSEIESIDGDEIEQKGPKVGTISSGIMAIMCRVGLKVN